MAILILASTSLGPAAWADGAHTSLGSIRTPSTATFVYLETRPQRPFEYHSSYVGLFHVQYDYGHPSLQWDFTIAKQWQTEAARNPVKFEYHVYTRGKEVNNYRTHIESAAYLFHSSIGTTFENKGDAPWTYHSLRVGDTVDIIARFSYMVAGSISQHDFWANYRVGIR